MEKAIEYGQKFRLQERQKLLVQNLCKLLESSYQLKTNTFKKALKVVEEVNDEKEKINLKYQVKEIEINQTMGYEKLQPSKIAILNFFGVIKNSNASNEELWDSSLDVLKETRSVLDYSLRELVT